MKKIITVVSSCLLFLCPLAAQNSMDGVIMPDKPDTKPYVDYSKKVSGFWAGVDVSSGASIHIDNAYKTSVTTNLNAVFGYRFNSFCQLGLGAGVKVYALQQDRIDPKNDGNIISVPVFFNVRGVMMNPRSREVVPCWSLDAGYAFFDGVYVAPTIGIRVGSLERHHFLAGVGYVLQGSEVCKTDGTHAPGYTHSIQLKLGYQF